MKTPIKSLVCAALIGAAISLPPATFAVDGNKPSHDKAASHITVVEGKVFLVKGSDKQALKEDVTLADGTKVSKEGLVTTKDGATATLQEGDTISLDGGKISKAGAAKDPSANEKDAPKDGNKSGQNTDK